MSDSTQDQQRETYIQVKKKLNPLEALRRMERDVERVVPSPNKKGSNNSEDGTVAYRPTPKAFLAKMGFLVQHSLGSGTYSKVKMAYKFNLKLDPVKLRASRPTKVAIKIIDTFQSPHDYTTKFMPRELAIWSTINNPYITPLLDSFRDGRYQYMVLPYAPGGDSLTYIQKHGALTEGAAHYWMRQVTWALMYLHQQGICHRDLKLENLLIDSHGDLVLADFGFVKGDCGPESDLSTTFCGSKSYAAPEILRGRPYDPCKADVWALGVVFYIFVTGQMPFDESKGTNSMLEEQRSLTFRGLKERHLSDDCEPLLMQMFTWAFPRRPTVWELAWNRWFGPFEEMAPDQRPPSAMETARRAYNAHGDT